MTFVSTGSPWIREFRPPGGTTTDGPVVVCLPHAGGSASFYQGLAMLLAPSATVVAAQYPGRQDRLADPPFLTIEEAAGEVVAGLAPWLGHRPLVLFGHSMGAMVGFEVARRLQEGPTDPARALVVSGCRGPSMDREKKYEHLDDEGVVAELKEQGGTDAELFEHPELVSMMLPAIRADYLAVERYQAAPDAVVACPVTALHGTEDLDCTPEEIEQWRPHTAGAFDLHAFPGGHFFVIDHWDVARDLILAGARS